MIQKNEAHCENIRKSPKGASENQELGRIKCINIRDAIINFKSQN